MWCLLVIWLFWGFEFAFACWLVILNVWFGVLMLYWLCCLFAGLRALVFSVELVCCWFVLWMFEIWFCIYFDGLFAYRLSTCLLVVFAMWGVYRLVLLLLSDLLLC